MKNKPFNRIIITTRKCLSIIIPNSDLSVRASQKSHV